VGAIRADGRDTSSGRTARGGRWLPRRRVARLVVGNGPTDTDYWHGAYDRDRGAQPLRVWLLPPTFGSTDPSGRGLPPPRYGRTGRERFPARNDALPLARRLVHRFDDVETRTR